MNLSEVTGAQDSERQLLAQYGIEAPGPTTLDVESDEMSALAHRLQRIGAILATLHGRRGHIEGQRKALKEGIETGMAIAAAKLDPKAYKTVAEKQGAVLEGEGSEALKEAKRLLIQFDAIAEMYNGYIEGYKVAWETISRQITVHVTEANLSTQRHN